ncbi:MAG: hypothetical protein ACTSR8_10815 [Promethearchaeota archaeon]
MSGIYNLYDFGVLIFCLTYSFVVIFILIQIRKKERIARPFLISLLIHFLLDLIGILFLFTYNTTTHFGEITDFSKVETQIINFYLALAILLFVLSPLYLIYNLEKICFKKDAIREKHLLTKIQLICIVLMVLVIVSFPLLGILFYGIVTFIQVFTFLFGFMYLSIRSTDKYRRNSLIIFSGYLGQFIINLIYFYYTNTNSYSDTFLITVGTLVLIRLAGLAVMAYGLLKLYAWD